MDGQHPFETSALDMDSEAAVLLDIAQQERNEDGGHSSRPVNDPYLYGISTFYETQSSSLMQRPSYRVARTASQRPPISSISAFPSSSATENLASSNETDYMLGGFQSPRSFTVQKAGPSVHAVKHANATVRDSLLLSVSFGVFSRKSTGNQHAQGRCEMLDSGPASFPTYLSDVTTLDHLELAQYGKFGLTYRYHGLKPSDVEFYEVQVMYTDAEDYAVLARCSTSDHWQETVSMVNAIYHHNLECGSPGNCSSCDNPPRVIVCFANERWNSALASRGLDSASRGFVLLDGYDEDYAHRLQNTDVTNFERYLLIARLSYNESQVRGLAGMCTPPPTLLHSDNISEFMPTEQNKSLNSTRRQQGTSIQQSQHQNSCSRLRIVPKVTDFSRATEKPSGMTKREDEICVTCLEHHRDCKGGHMVAVTVRGKTELRCPYCAKARRQCFWKEPDKNINSYDAAATYYQASKRPGNTRAARRAKALARLAQRDAATVEDEVGGGDTEDVTDVVGLEDENHMEGGDSSNGAERMGGEHDTGIEDATGYETDTADQYDTAYEDDTGGENNMNDGEGLSQDEVTEADDSIQDCPHEADDTKYVSGQ